MYVHLVRGAKPWRSTTLDKMAIGSEGIIIIIIIIINIVVVVVVICEHTTSSKHFVSGNT